MPCHNPEFFVTTSPSQRNRRIYSPDRMWAIVDALTLILINQIPHRLLWEVEKARLGRPPCAGLLRLPPTPPLRHSVAVVLFCLEIILDQLVFLRAQPG